MVKTLEQLREQFGEMAEYLTPEIGVQFDQVADKLRALADELRRRPSEDLLALRSDVKEMIDFVTKRGDAADAERFKYLQSSLQIIGFVLVVFSLVLTGLDKSSGLSASVLVVILSVGLSLSVAVAGALIVILMYFAQARFRYPFIYYRQLGNAWRWFYYGNVKANTPEGEFFYRNKEYQQTFAQNYASDLERYASRYVNDSPPEQILEDLRQLFLLNEHDRYKQRFKSHMVHACLYTACAAITAFVGGIIGSLFVQ
jgi:hypothetical protein